MSACVVCAWLQENDPGGYKSVADADDRDSLDDECSVEPSASSQSVQLTTCELK